MAILLGKRVGVAVAESESAAVAESEPAADYTPHPYVGGRDAVLELLADWRAERAGLPKTVVLTGSPGAGCSRLIAGFLMLCDQEFRQRLPLREMNPAVIPPDLPAPLVPRPDKVPVNEFPRALADALALGESAEGGPMGIAEVGTALAAFSEPVTIVVPDIDRAERAAPGSGVGLVREVLRPLAGANARLLLDLPRGLVGELTHDLPDHDFLVVDVDDPQWWDADGLARQVETALDPRYGAPELPFTTDATARGRLSTAITRAAGNNVLVMDLIVRGIFAAPEDFDAAGEERLPSTVDGVLGWHAERVGGDTQALRALLAPLALTPAESMPEGMCRRLVTALDGSGTAELRTDPGSEAASLFDSPALQPFVTRKQRRDGESEVSLVHPAIGEAVRSSMAGISDSQARIARSLLDSVPEQDWAKADPYVLSHLPHHTLEAGLLPHLLTDPGLFVHADPSRMLAAVERVPAESLGPQARTYRRVAPVLIRSNAEPPLRAALLETAFVEDGLGEYATALRSASMHLPWQTLWSVSVPGVRAVSAATLRPPEDPGETPQLPAAAAALVVPADTPDAVALEGGGEAGLLIHDLNRPVTLPDPDLDRLVLASEEVRSSAPLAFVVDTHAVQVWDRIQECEVTTFFSDRPIVDSDLAPEGVLLIATENCVTALRVRRQPGAIPV